MSSSWSGAMGRNRAIVLMHIGCCPEAQRYCRYRRYRVPSAADGQTNYAWNQIWFVEEVHEKKTQFFITVPWHLKSLAVCANAAQGRRGLWVIGSNQTGQMRVLTSETKLLTFLRMQGIICPKLSLFSNNVNTWLRYYDLLIFFICFFFCLHN